MSSPLRRQGWLWTKSIGSLFGHMAAFALISCGNAWATYIEEWHGTDEDKLWRQTMMFLIICANAVFLIVLFKLSDCVLACLLPDVKGEESEEEGLSEEEKE